MSKLHQIFTHAACDRGLLISPLAALRYATYFRFRGWRHVCTHIMASHRRRKKGVCWVRSTKAGRATQFSYGPAVGVCTVCLHSASVDDCVFAAATGTKADIYDWHVHVVIHYCWTLILHRPGLCFVFRGWQLYALYKSTYLLTYLLTCAWLATHACVVKQSK